MESTERSDLIILGRVIGSYESWDGDMDAMTYYAFKPCGVLSEDLPEGDLTVDCTKGDFIYFEDDGTLCKTIDMFSILSMVKRSEFA